MSAYQDALTLLEQGDAQAVQLMDRLREVGDESPDDLEMDVIVSHLAMTQIVLVAQVHAILAVADAIRDTGEKS